LGNAQGILHISTGRDGETGHPPPLRVNRGADSKQNRPGRHGQRRASDDQRVTAKGPDMKKALSTLVVAHLVGAYLSANFTANPNAAQPLAQEQNYTTN